MFLTPGIGWPPQVDARLSGPHAVLYWQKDMNVGIVHPLLHLMSMLQKGCLPHGGLSHFGVQWLCSPAAMEHDTGSLVFDSNEMKNVGDICKAQGGLIAFLVCHGQFHLRSWSSRTTQCHGI